MQKTVRELLEKGGKVVVLAHQGRRGDPDFTDLRQHAEIFSRFVGKNIRFVPDVTGVYAIQAIKSLSPGEAILLENVRILQDEDIEKPPEEHAKSICRGHLPMSSTLSSSTRFQLPIGLMHLSLGSPLFFQHMRKG